MRVAPMSEIAAHFGAFVEAIEEGPIVVTKSGKPVAVLLGITEEDEIERLILAYSPKFQAMLDAAASRIHETGGIRHEDFWRRVEAETD